MFFGVGDLNGAPLCRVLAATTAIVVGKSFAKIICFADIEGAVSTPQDVDEPHATTMPSSQEN
jgi:hypothetical protein